MNKQSILNLPEPNNLFCHLAGTTILLLNKIRHSIEGYKTPRTFPISEIDRAIDYDINVVNNWTDALKEYADNNFSLEGRRILELGPGADLGIGLTLLSRGAEKYNALDIHNLVKSVPDAFYERLFTRMQNEGVNAKAIEDLKVQLTRTTADSNDRLNYVCRNDFDINVFSEEGIDTVFSQAAFEHFDNIPLTLSRLSKIVKPGAYLAVEIDLNTHTRWIRDIDPLNIYRFSDTFYNICKFAGSPNRLNASEYKHHLEQCGWENVQVSPLVCVNDNYLRKVKPRLAKRFREKSDEIGYLSILVCAKKS